MWFSSSVMAIDQSPTFDKSVSIKSVIIQSDGGEATALPSALPVSVAPDRLTQLPAQTRGGVGYPDVPECSDVRDELDHQVSGYKLSIHQRTQMTSAVGVPGFS